MVNTWYGYRRKSFVLVVAAVLISSIAVNVYAQRKMEYLGRGLIAVRRSSSQVLVSWRIPVPEFYNGTTYNLYRGDQRIAQELELSNYVDNSSENGHYSVAAVENGVEQQRSEPVSVVQSSFGSNSIPALQVPLRNKAGYTPGLMYVGDFDGDGEYDFAFINNSWGETSPIIVEAYKRDGTFLWEYDCGPNSLNKDNIEPGSSALGLGHGDNMTVYDINNDGKAEVIIRTANGSRFADGSVLSESNDTRQFISVLDGMTGEELARAAVPGDYLSDGPMSGHMGIAYLDGENPSVVWSSKNRVGSGGFNMMVTTYDWNNGDLDLNWKWLRGGQNCPDGHNLNIVDVNGDGRDEIIPFGYCLSPEGTLLYSLGETGGLVHGDRFHLGDLDQNRPGLEGYAIQQDNGSGLAWAYYAAENGQILESQTIPGTENDLARGVAGDFDPRTPGYEFWTFTDGIYNVSGSRVSNGIPDSYPNMRIWWDGDLLSENLDNRKMTKWNYENGWEDRLYTFSSITQHARNVPGFYGDILGDWREEIVYLADDGSCLLIFTSLEPTSERIYTLAHNPGYRNCMTTRGYYQSNMADFYLGDGMNTPPRPDIVLVGQSSFTLNTAVVGSGSVTASPDTSAYEPQTEVALTATAEDGWEFSGWSGALSGTENPVTVTMTSDQGITAHFTPQVPSGTQKLSIVAADAGSQESENLAENSFDEDTASRWANDNTLENGWITFDLGTKKTVTAIRMVPFKGDSRTYELKIEVGDEQFTKVWSGSTQNSPFMQTIPVTQAEGRYVRVSATDVNSDGNNWLSIHEIEVWGNTSVASIKRNTSTIRSWSINVSREGLLVRSPCEKIISITLYNAQGRGVSNIYEGVLNTGVHTIPLTSKISGGFYVLTVRTNDKKEVYRRRLFIQR